MNEILVTGGAGFIGANVCKALKASGFVPVTVDNLSTGFLHNVKWGPFHNLDLRDFDQLQSKLVNYNFIGVVHLAASAYVGESQSDPIKYFDNNIVSTINLLKYMKEINLKDLVFSSSCTVYGKGNGDLFREDDICEPINNYGLSKRMCEEIITSVARSLGLRYVILRYFNASGFDIESGIIEQHNPETHVIPLLVNSALNGDEFKIFGLDYETSDGSPVRDYVHVSDLSNAHVKSIRYLKSGGANIILNLGSGKGTSVLELIEVAKRLGITPKVTVDERRKGDPPSLVADCQLAQRKLGWKPSNSEIECILKSVVDPTRA